MNLSQATEEAANAAKKYRREIAVVLEGPHADEHEEDPANSHGYCPVEAVPILYQHGKVVRVIRPVPCDELAAFTANLETLIADIRTRAIAQFERNRMVNDYATQEATTCAIQSAIAGGYGAFSNWEEANPVELAARLLEDVNLHDKAATVRN